MGVFVAVPRLLILGVPTAVIVDATVSVVVVVDKDPVDAADVFASADGNEENRGKKDNLGVVVAVPRLLISGVPAAVVVDAAAGVDVVIPSSGPSTQILMLLVAITIGGTNSGSKPARSRRINKVARCLARLAALRDMLLPCFRFTFVFILKLLLEKIQK